MQTNISEGGAYTVDDQGNATLIERTGLIQESAPEKNEEEKKEAPESAETEELEGESHGTAES